MQNRIYAYICASKQLRSPHKSSTRVRDTSNFTITKFCGASHWIYSRRISVLFHSRGSNLAVYTSRGCVGPKTSSGRDERETRYWELGEVGVDRSFGSFTVASKIKKCSRVKREEWKVRRRIRSFDHAGFSFIYKQLVIADKNQMCNWCEY